MPMGSSSLKLLKMMDAYNEHPPLSQQGISPVTTAGVLALVSAFKGWPPVAWPALL